MATTTNYSWTTPDDTALVKDGAAAIRSLGTAIDSTVFTNAGNAINKTIVDAKGDLIAATAADTVSRLAVGANDTVLIADSSTATGLKWGTPSAGGMTLINTGGTTSENVDQETIRVPEGKDKFEILASLFQDKTMDRVIIFTETKRLADRLSKKLNETGIKSGLIHGNKSQNFRNKTIEEFKNGTTRVLVATDVAARGIDVADVTHVINYQLPMSMDSYIHRIGRTGRAGKTGRAITFVN
jgi:Lhr-like helicase